MESPKLKTGHLRLGWSTDPKINFNYSIKLNFGLKAS